MCQLGMPKKFAPLSKKNGIPIARNINVLISFQNKNHVVILNTNRSYKFPAVVIYILESLDAFCWWFFLLYFQKRDEEESSRVTCTH